MAVIAAVACNTTSNRSQVPDDANAAQADAAMGGTETTDLANDVHDSAGAGIDVFDLSHNGRSSSNAKPRAVDASKGCGLPPVHELGGIQVEFSFSDLAGGKRSFYLSVPKSYDADVPQRLIVGFAGTNWVGKQIMPYLALETTDPESGELYVYPDVQWHDFKGWGTLGGWLLGPHANPADGMADIEFTRELIELLSNQYCIDNNRVFATGHSWGGDMAAVVGCFLGELFTAVAPAAANRPYWFEPDKGEVGCQGSSAVWTFFGQNDPHFSNQKQPGQFGDEQVDFWKQLHQCGESETVLGEVSGDCVQYEGCTRDTRYCFYDAEAGHQVPDYFSKAILNWFRGF